MSSSSFSSFLCPFTWSYLHWGEANHIIKVAWDCIVGASHQERISLHSYNINSLTVFIFYIPLGPFQRFCFWTSGQSHGYNSLRPKWLLQIMSWSRVCRLYGSKPTNYSGGAIDAVSTSHRRLFDFARLRSWGREANYFSEISSNSTHRKRLSRCKFQVFQTDSATGLCGDVGSFL